MPAKASLSEALVTTSGLWAGSSSFSSKRPMCAMVTKPLVSRLKTK